MTTSWWRRARKSDWTDRNTRGRSPFAPFRTCLREAQIPLRAVDCIAIGWNPGINVAARYRGGFSDRLRFAGEWLYSIPNHLLSRLDETEVAETAQYFKIPDAEIRIQHVTHHDAHAANAFFLSPFERAAIFTTDAYGEKTCTTLKLGQGNCLEPLDERLFPQSIGCFYSTITELLGYEPDGDEWKVMGMAAYGDPSRFRRQIKSLYRLTDNGGYEFDLTYFNYFNFDTAHMFSAKLNQLLGPARPEDEALSERHYDLAAAAQEALEEIVFHCLRHLGQVTQCKQLCLSGGTIMNSVCNGKIPAQTPFEDVYIPFSPDDTGNSLGAALWTLFCKGGRRRDELHVDHPFWGPGFTNADIQEQLTKYKLPFRQSADVTGETARLIADGKVVGWFQGRMEFGQRALGNRSILADPRDPTMKDRVNAAVKYREAFRPFAPSILHHRVAEYFEIEPQTSVPFMERVYAIRPSKRSAIPAVTHADGSGRLQTVTREFNPRYYDLIARFEQLTGVPIVLNTSFNLKGEPIVCSPSDAIRTFFTSGLDALVMGDFVISKISCTSR